MKFLSILFITFIFGTNNLSINTNIKEIAPEIKMMSAEGEMISLSSLRGNIVLVDFWASWCKPCRKSRPGIKAVYNQFKDSTFKNADAFKVYSVSLDKDKSKWKNAIKEYGLNWTTQVSDQKGFKSKTVKEYKITGIPNNVLLNEKGEIIARNVFKEDLEAALVSLQ